MKECPFCHGKIKDDARFCIHCMNVLSPRRPLTPLSRNRRILPLLISFCAFLLFCAVIAGTCFLFWGKKEVPLFPETEEKQTEEAPIPLSSPKITMQSEISLSGTVGTSKSLATQKTSTEKTDTTQKTSTTAKTSTAKPTTTKAPPVTTARVAEVYQYREARSEDLGGMAVPQNSITITGVKSLSSDLSLNIPPSIDGKRVVAIESGAFSDVSMIWQQKVPSWESGTRIKGLTLPEGLLGIGEYAFENCLRVPKLLVPDSVVYIGSSAFWSGVYDFVEIGTKTIPPLAFAESDIGKLTLKEGVETIGDHAFHWVDFTEAVLFPKSLKRVENGAFNLAYLNGQESVILPKTLEYLDESAFDDATKIEWK